MNISWLGHSCFKIEAKSNGDNITILIDPYDESIGLKMSKTKAEIVLITHDHHDHNNLNAVKGEPFVIKSPGEYEIKKVFVYGIPTYHDDKQGSERGANIAYRIDVDDLSVVHLGDLGHVLNDEQLELLEDADILMIPVDSKYTLGAKKASEVIAQIEPRIVIPMHYKVPGLKIDLDPIDAFCKEMGVKNTPIAEDKLKISKKDLMTEETKVIILPRQ
ncbi:MAG: MBL fold metallo-hydrolase [Patescibacteria group bacterium]